MKNPWIKLIKGKGNQYYLEKDLSKIYNFNRSLGKKDKNKKIQLGSIPEPFIGNPKAKVVLLNLNPGYNKESVFKQNKHKDFREKVINNLKHRKLGKYPFYYLDPKFAVQKHPGCKWWHDILKGLFENDKEKVSNSIFCIEYFPYHSKNAPTLKVESQNYNSYLVKKAIERKALIIIIRYEKQWLAAVPQLKEHTYIKLKNSQCGYISKGNLEESDFNKISDIILQ